jgi:hypothetical protein
MRLESASSGTIGFLPSTVQTSNAVEGNWWRSGSQHGNGECSERKHVRVLNSRRTTVTVYAFTYNGHARLEKTSK